MRAAAAKPSPQALPEPRHVCDQGLEIKAEMKRLEAEYAELKPQIEAWCEANGGSYNSPLGSYATRYTPEYAYPAAIEEMRLKLKAAEIAARADGTAVVVNTAVSVAATVVKNSKPKSKVRPIA